MHHVVGQLFKRMFCIVTLALGLPLMADTSSWSQSTFEIFQLNHRTAEELIPIIEPLLQGRGTVTGTHGVLIVRTTPDNLAMIKRILSQLDAARQNLRITVKQGLKRDLDRLRADVGAAARIGDKGHVVVNPRHGSASGATGTVRTDDVTVHGHLDHRRRRETGADTQYVVTLDGQPAVIWIGQRVPIQQSVIRHHGTITTHSHGVAYEDVMTGFSVLPQLRGDQVVLSIQPERSRVQQAGVINVQRVATTVQGKLGQWIEVAHLLQNDVSRQSRILGYSRKQGEEERTVILKVDVVE